MATRQDPKDDQRQPAAPERPSRFVTADLSLIEARESTSASAGGGTGHDADTAVLRRATGEFSAPSGSPPPEAAAGTPMRAQRGVSRFGLRMKFNAALLFTFAVGLALAAWLSNRVLRDNAREEVLQEARIMVESALSARAYTAQHIKPLLAEQMTEKFLPETVSAYAASQIFLSLRAKYPDYTYKEAALNPRNPTNRASDWEADLVNEFRNHPDRRELVVVRDTPTGQMMHLAKPLTVDDQGCLGCHSTPEQAPKPMLAIYGSANGFGWQLGEVVAAQVVTVPLSVPMARARDALTTFVLLLAGVFALLLVLLNVLLHFTVIQPVVRMANLATDVSMGKDDVADYVLHGGDEIASLSRSFHRMRVSLEKAMAMLDE